MQKNTKDLSSKKSIEKDLDVAQAKTKKTTAKATSKKSAVKSTKTATKKQPVKKSEKQTVSKKAVAKSTASKSAKTTKTTSFKTAKTTTATKTASAKTKTTANSTKKSSPKKAKVEVLEYYDLPYRYNQTVVRILAQTPNTLFVYWDISDADRKNYIDKFGENFFENTVPVLIVHNKTMNYSFEIEINDFANSWYFNVNDSKCDYEIELGRRAKQNSIELPNNYMHVTSSNVIEAPNNHILFEQNQKTLFFRNVKTNTTVSKDVSQFNFMKYAGRIYNIYNIYKEIYKHEELNDLENMSSSNF